MVGFSEHKAELDALDATVVAASVDDIDKAREVAEENNFPVGYGVTRADADTLGSWWEERRQIIQPSEFIVGADNRVVISSYSDGPLARTQAPDVVSLLKLFEARAAKAAAGG